MGNSFGEVTTSTSHAAMQTDAHQRETRYTVGDYLLDRLAELGISEMFGVPGDYNLRFLDSVVAHRDITWVGASNELNAGYAADGYARIRGAAALLTTYGVGELSAINALAGSFAESVPVVHIVGSPNKEIQATGAKIHHTLGDGDFQHFLRMAREVTCAAVDLDAPTATWEIDRVLRTVMFEKRPGILVLAADVAATPATPPTAPLELITHASTAGAEQAFEAALREFLAGKQVTVLADLLVHRVGASAALDDLLARTGLPVATLSWGKTLVDESAANFVGIYSGAASQPAVRHAVEDADALISLGVEFTDNTTAGFSMELDPARSVDVRRSESRVAGRAFTPLPIATAIEIIARVVEDLGVRGMPLDEAGAAPRPVQVTGTALTQDALWSQVAGSLTPGNIVLAEQGTSYFGMSEHRFPREAMFIGQPLWGSIGYTLPATLGAGLADRDRRPVLLIGDGSAQMTIQELGQLVRHRVPAVVILVNNDGYTVERMIHGPEQVYNDIATWRWELALRFFGAADDQHLTLRATTDAELRDALAAAAEHPDWLVLIEAVTDAHDAPAAMRAVTDRL